jgi:hypothetical protein
MRDICHTTGTTEQIFDHLIVELDPLSGRHAKCEGENGTGVDRGRCDARGLVFVLPVWDWT